VTGPVVTLTTDFGLRDPFVGIMKGVILGICPDARLVDLTHDVAPHDVLEAALALEASLPFFPAGTVHLVVVDPGVGSARRALAVAAGGQVCAGPDNGVLSPALGTAGRSAVALASPAHRLPSVSRTFHGRDVFAPAAAHLAAGTPLERLGPPVLDPVTIAMPGFRLERGVATGEVIGWDRFGNLVTSIPGAAIDGLGSGPVAVEVGGRGAGEVVECYADARIGEPGGIVGSSGRLEVFVREGSARAHFGAGRGAMVRARGRAG
jgi:S-adenosylmethionine hydrolase